MIVLRCKFLKSETIKSSVWKGQGEGDVTEGIQEEFVLGTDRHTSMVTMDNDALVIFDGIDLKCYCHTYTRRNELNLQDCT